MTIRPKDRKLAELILFISERSEGDRPQMADHGRVDQDEDRLGGEDDERRPGQLEQRAGLVARQRVAERRAGRFARG